MEKRKVMLIKRPDGTINLIPLEDIKDCQIIIPNEKLGLWVHLKSIPGGASDGIGSDHKVRDLNDEDIESILKNDKECFVEVNYRNELAVIKNGAGGQKIALFFSREER